MPSVAGRKKYHERSHSRDDNKVAIELYLFQKKKEYIDKIPKGKENGCRNQI